MSSLTGVSVQNAPWNYYIIHGYAAWQHPRRFRRAEGFFPLVAQTASVPFELEHPRWLTYAALLFTAYGSKGIYSVAAAMTGIFFIYSAKTPVPLGIVTSFLAGCNIDSRNWRYVWPALVKVYGVDPVANSMRDYYTDDLKGFLAIETIALLTGWFHAFSQRRFWGGRFSKYQLVGIMVSLLVFNFVDVLDI